MNLLSFGLVNGKWKSRKQIFHKKKDIGKVIDIKYLSNDKNTIKCYSEALENSVGDTTNITDIDKLCDKITSAIQTSSEATIPIRTNANETKPWVDDTFLKLIGSRNQCKVVDERLLLNKELKKYRDKIKNEYYGKKAASINVASEARNVEAEFRKMSDYSALNKSK